MIAPTQAMSTGSNDAFRPLGIQEVQDLLAVPGFTPDMLAKLKPFIIILPTVTQLNVNTAPPEVLAAKIATLSLQNATALVASRATAPFRDISYFQAQLENWKAEADINTMSVRTNYFLVDGKVKLNHANLEVLALIQRSNMLSQLPGSATQTTSGATTVLPPFTTSVIWIREQ